MSDDSVYNNVLLFMLMTATHDYVQDANPSGELILQQWLV